MHTIVIYARWFYEKKYRKFQLGYGLKIYEWIKDISTNTNHAYNYEHCLFIVEEKRWVSIEKDFKSSGIVAGDHIILI